jgi:hypothetical protein
MTNAVKSPNLGLMLLWLGKVSAVQK